MNELATGLGSHLDFLLLLLFTVCAVLLIGIDNRLYAVISLN